MIEIPRTAQELVEKYCPNYEERVQRWRYDNTYNVGRNSRTSGSFRVLHFKEALTHFAEVVAEKQRELCSAAYVDYNGEDTDYETVSEAIYNAPSPLKTE